MRTTERLDDYHPQLHESVCVHFLNNKYDFRNVTDDERFSTALKCLHSINDTTLGGTIDSYDFNKIALFLSDIYYDKHIKKNG